MLSSTTESLVVTESSQVAEARRRVAAITGGIGLSETEQGEAAIIATEMATNLVKHATSGGELLVNTSIDGNRSRVTLLSVDQGPGMVSVEECMRDGFSTAGSSGSGLGALARLSSSLEIYSRRGSGLPRLGSSTGGSGAGTIISAELHHAGAGQSSSRHGVDMFGLAVPYPGETACGDAWGAIVDGSRMILLVVDGLGHGVVAATAATAAIAELERSWKYSPADVLEAIHGALRSTRGAVAGIAAIDFERRDVTYAGIGNIGAAIVTGGQTKRLLSHNGTLGHQARRFQELVYPFPAGATLVMHSDGLSTHWDLANYPGITGRPAALTAGLLYGDARRQRDDATVVVVREEEQL